MSEEIVLRRGAKDITGMKFGRMTVNRPHGIVHRFVAWKCTCDCGAETVVLGSSLRSGNTRSCGCLLRTHGGTGTKLWRKWKSIIDRCCNPNNSHYHMYGGRGISICERWRHDFAAFKEDMGERPTRFHSIDRIDNDRGYEPSNCRWATRKQQARNTRRNRILQFNGRTATVVEFAEELGFVPQTLYRRLSSGWTVERALTTPVLEPS